MNQNPVPNNTELNTDEAQVGRILHFVAENSWGLVCRPAIVVEDWPSQGKPGYVNLQVFTDGLNDGKFSEDALLNVSKGVVWETSVLPNHAVRAHRTWHWPRECTSMQKPAPPFIQNGQNRHHNHAEGFVDTNNCYACSLEKEQYASKPSNA